MAITEIKYDFGEKYKKSGRIGAMLIDNFYNTLHKCIADLDINSALEMGCGEGLSTQRVVKILKGVQLSASEYRDDLVEVASTNNPGISITQEDIYSTQRSDGEFDLVICMEVLEHLESPQEALAQLHRITNRYCLLSVPNEPIWRILNMCRGKYWSDLGNTPGHINNWSTKQFLSLLEGKFRPVRVEKPLPWSMVLCEKL